MREPYVPREHDAEVIAAMVDRELVAVFADPGLGKTGCTLSAAKELLRRFAVDRVLVVAPLGVVYTSWPDETAKWDRFEGMRLSIIHGSPKKRLKAIQAEADIYVINPDGLQWLEEQDWAGLPEMLVVDESTQFRRLRNGNFRALRRLLKRFRRRYILTGTPTPRDMLDLFPQMFIVDMGASLGTKIKGYKEKYFVPIQRDYGIKWELRDGAFEQIARAIAPYSIRIEASALKGLPEVMTVPVEVVLPPAARAVYDEFRREKVVEVEGRELVAANSGVLSGKLRQMASGRYYHTPLGGERETLVLHRAKVDRLRELCVELGSKPRLIPYAWDCDLDGIREALGDVPVINGDTPVKERVALQERWNRGELLNLAIHPRCGSLGLNLQYGGHIFIWYSLPTDGEQYDQMIKRLHRPPQTQRIMNYQLIARATYDRRVMNILAGKDRSQRAFLDALKDEISAHNDVGGLR